MRIHDAIVAASTDMQSALLVDENGKVINEMTGDAFGHPFGDDLEIVRGTLCQILMDHIPVQARRAAHASDSGHQEHLASNGEAD